MDPYTVLQRVGRWHLFGHCHLRGGVRLFRLDRVLDAKVLEKVFERPAELDGPEAVIGAVVNAHGPWEVEVLLETDMEHAREQVSPMVASLEEDGGETLMSCTTDSLNGMARVLSGLFCPFVVRRPAELREALRRHAAEISSLAERIEGKVES